VFPPIFLSRCLRWGLIELLSRDCAADRAFCVLDNLRGAFREGIVPAGPRAFAKILTVRCQFRRVEHLSSPADRLRSDIAGERYNQRPWLCPAAQVKVCRRPERIFERVSEPGSQFIIATTPDLDWFTAFYRCRDTIVCCKTLNLSRLRRAIDRPLVFRCTCAL
jgi:hypothetical protein